VTPRRAEYQIAILQRPYKVGKATVYVPRPVGASLDKNILREEERYGGVRVRVEHRFFCSVVQAVRRFVSTTGSLILRIPIRVKFPLG
jgi:hypothetical protein